MNQKDFIRRREPDWRWMEGTLISNRHDFRKRASAFPAAHRRIVRDLNVARAEDFDSDLVRRLNDLVLKGHSRLYENRRFDFNRFVDFAASGFPRAVRSEWRLLTMFIALFVVFAVVFGFLMNVHPWRMSRWFSPTVAAELKTMYNPEAEHFLRPREVSGDADMFGFYIYNNISIAFQSFAGGIVAGIGGVLFMIYNAVFLGSAAGYLISLGYGESFFAFVFGHGTVELLAIIFAAAAGTRFGFTLLRPPGRLTRREGLKVTARRALPLLYGSLFLLIIAATIEAFWSSRRFPTAVKLGFGALMAVATAVYLIRGGRR